MTAIRFILSDGSWHKIKPICSPSRDLKRYSGWDPLQGIGGNKSIEMRQALGFFGKSTIPVFVREEYCIISVAPVFYRIRKYYVQMSTSRGLSDRLMDIGPVRRHSLIAFISSIGVTVIGFFATIYIAHNAGAAALGGFFLLLAYVGVIGLFTDGGISGAALQRISEGDSQGEYFSAHAAIRCILLAATLTVLIAIRPVFVDLNQSGLFLWLLAALVVSTAAGIISTGVYGSGKVGILQIADLANNIIRVIVQVIAVYLGYSVGGLAADFCRDDCGPPR